MGVTLACEEVRAVKLDEFVNGKAGCKCPKNYSIVVILEIWGTHGEEDSLCPQGACDMHAQKQETRQDRTGNVRLSSCMKESGEGSSVQVV